MLEMKYFILDSEFKKIIYVLKFMAVSFFLIKFLLNKQLINLIKKKRFK